MVDLRVFDSAFLPFPGWVGELRDVRMERSAHEGEGWTPPGRGAGRGRTLTFAKVWSRPPDRGRERQRLPRPAPNRTSVKARGQTCDDDR